MELVDTTVYVDTHERVRFRYRVAGPGVRGAAWLVDLAIQAFVIAVGLVVAALFGSLGAFGGGLGGGLFLALLFVVSWFYGAAFEWAWSGQTPGKRLLSLRVVRSDGAPVAFRDAVMRNLMRGVDGLPIGYVVGILVAVANRRMLRLGDFVAGTMVVMEVGTRLHDAVPLDPPVSEAERQALPLRVDLTAHERASIEALLRRRERLGAERVEELAGYLGPSLSARTGVVAPTWLRTLALAWARAAGRER